MTVLIMKLHFSGEHGGKVPSWLRKLVLVCLARVVRMGKMAYSHENLHKVSQMNNPPVSSWIKLSLSLSLWTGSSVWHHRICRGGCDAAQPPRSAHQG